MNNIVLSGLVGLLSYFVLSSGNKKTKIEEALLTETSEKQTIKQPKKQEGGDLCTDVNSNYSNHPDCFEICKIAIDIFNELQYIDKCGNKAYNLLAKLYSEIFCFEMALGNNNLNLIEDAKVDSKIKDISKDYPNLNNTESLNKYLKESFKRVEQYLKDLGASKEMLEKSSDVEKEHIESILKLYEKYEKSKESKGSKGSKGYKSR